jgi:predicted transcriptional regulator
MKRLNFTFDDETTRLLSRLAEAHFSGNKSLTVRAALERFARQEGHEGWIISGYTPLRAPQQAVCRRCGKEQEEGELLYRPVFERGSSPAAMDHLPEEEWTECVGCVDEPRGGERP